MQSDKEIIDIYVNLLITQYNSKTKASSNVDLLVGLALATQIYLQVENAYDIDTAVGNQLDTLAKYVGVDRGFSSLDITAFSMAFNSDDWENISPRRKPFASNNNTGDAAWAEGVFLSNKDKITPKSLTDDEDFRKLIKLKIIQNNNNHSRGEIDRDIFNLFGNDVSIDSTVNMIMTYTINNNLEDIFTSAFQKNAIPRPMGVFLNLIII